MRNEFANIEKRNDKIIIGYFGSLLLKGTWTEFELFSSVLKFRKLTDHS